MYLQLAELAKSWLQIINDPIDRPWKSHSTHQQHGQNGVREDRCKDDSLRQKQR